MMTAKECADAWKTVVQYYNETKEVNNPSVTMQKIMDVLGMEHTREVFATVAKIKEHDGRIYGNNRIYMNSISVNPDCLQQRDNPVRYAGLDDIHTAHINQLITALQKLDQPI